VGEILASPVIFWLQKDPTALPQAEALSRVKAEILPCPLDSWPQDRLPAGFVIRGPRAEVLPALHRIRRASGLLSSTPILLISEDFPEEVFEGEKWLKGVDVLPEPLNAGTLARKLDFFVSLHDRSEALCSWWREETFQGDPELSQSKFLDSLIENIPNMVFVKEAANLRFVRFNRAGEELLGYSRSDLIGKSDFDFFPAAQAKFFVEKDRAVLEGESIVEIAEEVIRTKSRGERILHTKKIPIFDTEGQPAYLLGISEDITDQIRKDQERLLLIREQAMLEERESINQRMMFLAEASMVLTASFDYRRSLKMLSEMVVPFFSDWCSIYLSRQNQRPELVASRGDAMSRSMEEFVSRYAKTLQHRRPEEFVAMEKKNVFEAETGILGMRSFLSVPILVRGEVLGVLQFATGEGGRAFAAEDLGTAEELGRRAGIAIDNALLYETAQKAIQARDEFLSIASHELKTPMTSLKLQVQMTRRMVDTRENKVPSAARLAKVLDISAVQVDRLNALVDDLLDVSRIESGKLTYEFENVEIGQLVREMVERYFENLHSAGCQVTVETPELVWVKGDRFRLEQVVLNLLSNAAKYGRSQPVNVVVKSDGGRACILMRDHGIGIAKEMIEKVFERFERASPSGHIGGLGLGLYICREIVRAHGGNISIQSQLGEGSTFAVEIPLLKAEIAGDGLFSPGAGKNTQSYSPLIATPAEKLAQ
jgi:PAS domain S-box-containing protein